MEEKTLDDEQYGSEEQQETKGFGDSTGCGWMQRILGLSGSGDRCLEGGPRVEAIFARAVSTTFRWRIFLKPTGID